MSLKYGISYRCPFCIRDFYVFQHMKSDEAWLCIVRLLLSKFWSLLLSCDLRLIPEECIIFLVLVMFISASLLYELPCTTDDWRRRTIQWNLWIFWSDWSSSLLSFAGYNSSISNRFIITTPCSVFNLHLLCLLLASTCSLYIVRTWYVPVSFPTLHPLVNSEMTEWLIFLFYCAVILPHHWRFKSKFYLPFVNAKDEVTWKKSENCSPPPPQWYLRYLPGKILLGFPAMGMHPWTR